MPHVVVSSRGVDRLRAGHVWIYRSDVVRSDAAPGDLVTVVTERERPLGLAWWSSASLIALRFVARAGRGDVTGETADDERAWLASRVARAVACRDALGIDATACRLVHAESDALPGTIVDRYGEYLVVQTLCQAADRRLPWLVDALVAAVAPQGILARNDPKVRRLEGLPEVVDVVYGDVPDEVVVREGPIRYRADLWRGQKTGLFLDQRENHEAAGRLASGRALDAFAYHGGFALRMAGACREVLALEASETAVGVLRANAAENGVTNVEPRVANAFDELRELEAGRETFETIVLDPPAFARNKAAVDKAAAGYKEINLRAMRLLAPGGYLVTCSCSYNVGPAQFEAIVASAAADAQVPMRLVERRLQARDHPIVLTVPETQYLKCLVLQRA